MTHNALLPIPAIMPKNDRALFGDELHSSRNLLYVCTFEALFTSLIWSPAGARRIVHGGAGRMPGLEHNFITSFVRVAANLLGSPTATRPENSFRIRTRLGIWRYRLHESCRTMSNRLAIRKKTNSSKHNENSRCACRGSIAARPGVSWNLRCSPSAEAALSALSLSARRRSMLTALPLSRDMGIGAMFNGSHNLDIQQSGFCRVHSSAPANSVLGRQSIRRPGFSRHAAGRARAPLGAESDQPGRRSDAIE